MALRVQVKAALELLQMMRELCQRNPQCEAFMSDQLAALLEVRHMESLDPDCSPNNNTTVVISFISILHSKVDISHCSPYNVSRHPIKKKLYSRS